MEKGLSDSRDKGGVVEDGMEGGGGGPRQVKTGSSPPPNLHHPLRPPSHLDSAAVPSSTFILSGLNSVDLSFESHPPEQDEVPPSLLP